MMAEEHGQPKAPRLPWKAALGTFGAFLVCGSIPLLPFVAGAMRFRGLAEPRPLEPRFGTRVPVLAGARAASRHAERPMPPEAPEPREGTPSPRLAEEEFLAR
jgi:hypothetical protein